MMIHHITQKDQEILLLRLEIKDLKSKLQNAEAREAELNDKLSQSKRNSSKLRHQLEQILYQFNSIDNLDPPTSYPDNKVSALSKEVKQSTLDIKEIEQICKSVVSTFAGMANVYMDRNIQLLKDQVSIFLTAQLMRADKGNGLKNLNHWIKQVENCASSNSLRIQMIRLKADPDVLNLIKKDGG